MRPEFAFLKAVVLAGCVFFGARFLGLCVLLAARG
jgi:hypothetical protein